MLNSSEIHGAGLPSTPWSLVMAQMVPEHRPALPLSALEMEGAQPEPETAASPGRGVGREAAAMPAAPIARSR